MSKAVPHYSPEWLDQYRKRMASVSRTPKAQSTAHEKPTETPTHARGEVGGVLVPYSAAKSAEVPFRVSEGKQSKTEQKYNREILGGKGRFEAVCLYLPGGGRYTPDFMTIDDGIVTFHEVKGSYRLGSQGRAYTAFHEAAAYFPMWRFVWAHWTGKEWERKTIENVGLFGHG